MCVRVNLGKGLEDYRGMYIFENEFIVISETDAFIVEVVMPGIY
jgi:hypothetical protein